MTIKLSQSPQFGWSWAGHEAIERVAIEFLPSDDAQNKSFKAFLRQNREAIHQHSIYEDTLKNNKPHLFFWEQLNRPETKKSL